jgi:hypothetical protein
LSTGPLVRRQNRTRQNGAVHLALGFATAQSDLGQAKSGFGLPDHFEAVTKPPDGSESHPTWAVLLPPRSRRIGEEIRIGLCVNLRVLEISQGCAELVDGTAVNVVG